MSANAEERETKIAHRKRPICLNVLRVATGMPSCAEAATQVKKLQGEHEGGCERAGGASALRGDTKRARSDVQAASMHIGHPPEHMHILL